MRPSRAVAWQVRALRPAAERLAAGMRFLNAFSLPRGGRHAADEHLCVVHAVYAPRLGNVTVIATNVTNCSSNTGGADGAMELQVMPRGRSIGRRGSLP